MANPILQRGSKFRDAVARLQLALQGAGLSVKIDGAYGRGTENAVKEFQTEHGLEADGVVGDATWQALAESAQSEEDNPLDSSELLPGFSGDLSWVYRWQKHAGGPYWPGGSAMGVHLDPGLDLGHVAMDTLESAYRDHLDDEAWQAVQEAVGVRGDAAQALLRSNRHLRGIPIDRDTAESVFPHVADPVWRALVRRFPSLARDTTPANVQTALLSLAVDHGPTAGALEPLRRLLADRDWAALADAVDTLDQFHRLESTQERRHEEAQQIRQAVE